jgi:hypothetical protein
MPEFDPKAVPDPRLADPAATDAARPRSRSRPRSPASITPWATVRACLSKGPEPEDDGAEDKPAAVGEGVLDAPMDVKPRDLQR